MGAQDDVLGIADDTAAAAAQHDQQQTNPCVITVKAIDGSMCSRDTSTCDGHIQLQLPAAGSSMYSLYSRRRRGFILAAISIAQCLAPFNDCIILPGLKVNSGWMHPLWMRAHVPFYSRNSTQTISANTYYVDDG
jgi:hypothetical protein